MVKASLFIGGKIPKRFAKERQFTQRMQHELPMAVIDRAQADSLSAGAGGRWKIVACGAAEIVDGSPSHLRAEGRRRTQSSVREPPEFVRSGIAGADD